MPKDKDFKKQSNKLALHKEITRRNKIEKTLQKSEEELHQQKIELLRANQNISDILESIQDNLYVIDREWNYVYINKKAASSLNMKPEDFIGKNLWKLFPKYAGTEDGIKFRNSMEKREISRFETHSKYTGIWYDVNVYPSNEGITILGTDITERKNIEEQKQKLLEKEKQLTEDLRLSNEDLYQKEKNLIRINLELQKSEQRFSRLYNSGLIGVIYWNMDNKIVDANDKFLEMVGYTRKDLESGLINWSEMTPPEYRYLDERSVVELKDTGVNKEPFEKEYIRKDGTRIPIIIAGAMLDEARFNGAAYVIDNSERKKAEIELMESEEKFREVFNNAKDMISLNLFINDRIPGKFIEVNKIGIDRLGYSYDEFLNMTPADIVAPDKRSEMERNAIKLLENGQNEFEIIHQTKDGKRIPVEVNNHLFKLHGNTIALAISRDITKRKQVEEELFISEEKFRTLFEEDPDYNLLLGIDGTILEINKAVINLIGKSKKDLLGKNYSILKITPPEDKVFHLENINKVLKGENVKPFESRFIDKNGNIHWIILHLTAVKDTNISYILAIGNDITNRKLAEQKINSSLKEKENLLKEIHHRVKNNMQIISSLLNLQTQYVDGKETVDVLKESQNRVKSMAMIHEKIYLSKDLTHINFVDYIQSLVSNLFYSYNIEKNRIKPVLDIDNVNLNMETAVPCGLIISELVSNSLKYAFPDKMKGKIYISLKSKEDKYELVVCDNGIGIKKELDFYHLESLGLLLVKNLTEQIEGRIDVNLSHGTEFKISFKELEYKKRI